MRAKTIELKPGLLGIAEITVTERHTAVSMGSGHMPVLATPAMIVLMEAAAQKAVDSLLPPGHQTVGTHLDVHHYGATPVGMRVVATAELTAVEGRNLVFKVEVRDDKELIGEGSHRRTISSVASFNRLLQQKMQRAGAEIPNTKTTPST
jgi:fluoroacetyl-CoA thioesterase